MYVLKRLIKTNTGKFKPEEHPLVRLMTVIRDIIKYKNLSNWPSTTRIEVIDGDGDLIYYYDVATGLEEIYRADGSPTRKLEEMGK